MDCSLELDYMNKELLVIVNHHVTVNFSQVGTYYSSGAENYMCNKFGQPLFFYSRFTLNLVTMKGGLRMYDFDWC